MNDIVRFPAVVDLAAVCRSQADVWVSFVALAATLVPAALARLLDHGLHRAPSKALQEESSPAVCFERLPQLYDGPSLRAVADKSWKSLDCSCFRKSVAGYRWAVGFPVVYLEYSCRTSSCLNLDFAIEHPSSSLCLEKPEKDCPSSSVREMWILGEVLVVSKEHYLSCTCQ